MGTLILYTQTKYSYYFFADLGSIYCCLLFFNSVEKMKRLQIEQSALLFGRPGPALDYRPLH